MEYSVLRKPHQVLAVLLELSPDPLLRRKRSRLIKEDGEWTAPTIANPEYKGPWKPKKIKNPNYSGKWKAPLIDNPDFKDDPDLYVFKLKYVGIELWQIYVVDSLDPERIGKAKQEFCLIQRFHLEGIS